MSPKDWQERYFSYILPLTLIKCQNIGTNILLQQFAATPDTYKFRLIVGVSDAGDLVEGRENDIGCLLGVGEVPGEGRGLSGVTAQVVGRYLLRYQLAQLLLQEGVGVHAPV